jgi:hypothetical protein
MLRAFLIRATKSDTWWFTIIGYQEAFRIPGSSPRSAHCLKTNLEIPYLFIIPRVRPVILHVCLILVIEESLGQLANLFHAACLMFVGKTSFFAIAFKEVLSSSYLA